VQVCSNAAFEGKSGPSSSLRDPKGHGRDRNPAVQRTAAIRLKSQKTVYFQG
jgi:hypothetical protein